MGMDKSSPIVATAYAVVPSEGDRNYDDFANMNPTATAIESCQEPTTIVHEHSVQKSMQYIPEARYLTWMDDYFDTNDDDIVAVFDLDYDLMEDYYTSAAWLGYSSTFLCQNIFWILTVCGTPCLLRRNMHWSVRSQHVAVTRDGVLFVKDRHHTCWGMPWSDAGKVIHKVRMRDCRNWVSLLWIQTNNYDESRHSGLHFLKKIPFHILGIGADFV